MVARVDFRFIFDVSKVVLVIIGDIISVMLLVYIVGVYCPCVQEL